MILLLLLLISCAPVSEAPQQNKAQHSPEHSMMSIVATNDTVDLHNLEISFLRPAALTTQDAVIAFNISQEGKTAQLEIVHEKPLHLFIVRNDFNYFDHVHPELAADGTYRLPFHFLANGTYYIWPEFTVGGMTHLVRYALEVSGESKLEPTLAKTELTIDDSENPQIILSINDTAVIPYLGAAAHLVLINKQTAELSHGHDETLGEIMFSQHLAPADYAMWVEYNNKDGKQRTKHEFTIQKPNMNSHKIH